MLLTHRQERALAIFSWLLMAHERVHWLPAGRSANQPMVPICVRSLNASVTVTAHVSYCAAEDRRSRQRNATQRDNRLNQRIVQDDCFVSTWTDANQVKGNTRTLRDEINIGARLGW